MVAEELIQEESLLGAELVASKAGPPSVGLMVVQDDCVAEARLRRKVLPTNFLIKVKSSLLTTPPGDPACH